MSDTILKCDYDLELTEFSLELEPVTEAQPLQPLEPVEPVKVELVWPLKVGSRGPARSTRLRTSPDRISPRPPGVPARPVPGQLWMGTPRVTPRERRLRRRSRTGLGRFVIAFLTLFAAQS